MSTQMCQRLSHNFLLICTQQRAWDRLHELDFTQTGMTSHTSMHLLSAVNNLLQSAYLIMQSLDGIAQYKQTVLKVRCLIVLRV